MVEYNLEKRRLIARILCSELSDSLEEFSLDHRIYIIEAIDTFLPSTGGATLQEIKGLS
jgi:hypothetical protein